MSLESGSGDVSAPIPAGEIPASLAVKRQSPPSSKEDSSARRSDIGHLQNPGPHELLEVRSNAGEHGQYPQGAALSTGACHSWPGRQLRYGQKGLC